jgi:O-acetyl-ADP-ribose deacetylase (regulator of RNase III)
VLITVHTQALAAFLEEQSVHGIINAANGCGVMGAGVAGAIAKLCGGDSFVEHVKNVATVKGPRPAGEAYITHAGALIQRDIHYIVHAVTMQFPGSPTTIEKSMKALYKALTLATDFGLETLAIPALGTGIGRLDKEKVADLMLKVIRHHEKTAPPMRIYIVDVDPVFTNHFSTYLNPSLL